MGTKRGSKSRCNVIYYRNFTSVKMSGKILLILIYSRTRKTCLVIHFSRKGRELKTIRNDTKLDHLMRRNDTKLDHLMRRELM